MIKFACGDCGRLITVDAKYAGRKGKCPKCGNAITVPKRSTVISFACGQCGHKIEVPEVHAGKKGRCPKCKSVVVVPAGEEQPAERANTVMCSMCGEVIGPEGAPGTFVECPGCGAYVDASSGVASPESDGSLPPDADEDLAEESVETAGRSAGPDRRLIIVVAAIAAVVVVGSVILVAALRSSGPRPTERPRSPRAQREDAAADLQPEPAVSAASSEEPIGQDHAGGSAAREQAVGPGVTGEAAGMARLQFRPVPGTKRTVQLATKVTISIEGGGLQNGMTNTESIDFDLGVGELSEDGTAAINVSLAAIRVKSEAPGQPVSEYDSTKPQTEGNVFADIYGSYLAIPFTVKVSPRGEIVDPGLDGLVLAAAERRVQSQDDLLREQRKERADQDIQRLNERFGSRQDRVLAMKKQLEEFPIFSKQLVVLLNRLFVALPDQPVRAGDTWDGPLGVEMDLRMALAGTYTLTADEQGVCTVQAKGERSADEPPVIEGNEQMKVSNKLGGSSEATLRIERRTGWLVGKEQRTHLQGEITTTMAAPQPQNSSSRVSVEITSTLATIR